MYIKFVMKAVSLMAYIHTLKLIKWQAKGTKRALFSGSVGFVHLLYRWS